MHFETIEQHMKCSAIKATDGAYLARVGGRWVIAIGMAGHSSLVASRAYLRRDLMLSRHHLT